MSLRSVQTCRIFIFSLAKTSYSESLVRQAPASYFHLQYDERRLRSSWSSTLRLKNVRLAAGSYTRFSSSYLNLPITCISGLLQNSSFCHGPVRYLRTSGPQSSSIPDKSQQAPHKCQTAPDPSPVSKEEKKKDETPPEKMTLFQKFKAMYRDYWYVLVPVHVVTSAMFYGSFYYMARTGVDVASLAEWAHLSDELVEKIRRSGNSLAGHLTIAYLLYKVATPIRYTVTLGGTTMSINYLKKWGLIKPVPKRAELQKMYQDKKVELRKKRDSLRERKDLLKKSVFSKLSSKKRMKNTSDYVRRILLRKKRKG